MADIRSLRGDAIHTKKPNDGVVAHLEDLLEMAKSGEVVGVAVAALHDDYTASFGVVGHVVGYSMLGALEMAKAEIVDINREDDF